MANGERHSLSCQNKKILHDIIHKQYLKYLVNEMAKAHGHEVVHLPPYHFELNPI